MIDLFGDPYDWVDMLLSAIVGGILVLFYGILFGLAYKGIDRKLAAHLQARIGPPLRQPFWDVRKLLTKETVIPDNAIPWIFNAAPIAALVSAVLSLLYLPISRFDPILGSEGDLILVIYLLALPGLAMVVGGFASGSPFATIGAQREMVMMISYELPLAAVIVALAWRINYDFPNIAAFSSQTFLDHTIWSLDLGAMGILGTIILLLVLLMVTPMEMSKIPFDVPEAETEIAGGLLVEYSGRNLAMFYLTDAVKTLVMATLIVLLFFPFGINDVLSLLNLATIGGASMYVLDFLLFVLKLFFVIFASVIFIRVSMARLKIDQIARIYLFGVTSAALVGMALLYLDTLTG